MKGSASLLFVFAVLLAGCIPPTSDPVSVGEFCFGGGDCDGSVLLEREAVGRSRIDFLVRNVGDTDASVSVFALVPSVEVAAQDAGSDASNTDAGTSLEDPTDLQDRLVAGRTYDIDAGSNASDRFAATVLGTRRNIELAATCDDCSVVVEFVFETEPLECRDESDCSSGWLCDPALGRCAECLTNSDCSEEQRCDESARCNPEIVEAGCSAAGGSPGNAGLVLLLAAFAAVGLARRRRWVIAGIVAATCAISSAPATAAAPGAGFSLGVGPRWITGELGPVVQRGIGVSIGQELRWDYVGLGVQLNWAAFLTTQDPPPFSRNIQMFDFTSGPRGYLPLGDFDIVLSGDYKRIGLAANSLVRLTGNDNGYHAFGATLGGRWDGLGLETRADVGVHHIPNLNSQLVMFELSIALTAGR